VSLEQELATFERELPTLLGTRRGEYALIHGDGIDSIWKTENEAYTAGCDRFGIEPFLVMRIDDQPRPIPFFQDVPPYAPNQQRS
jgi:hypothetical protein